MDALLLDHTTTAPWLLRACLDALPRDGSTVDIGVVLSRLAMTPEAIGFTTEGLVGAVREGLASLAEQRRAYESEEGWSLGLPEGFAWSMYYAVTSLSDRTGRRVAQAATTGSWAVGDLRADAAILASGTCGGESETARLRAAERAAVRECWARSLFGEQGTAISPDARAEAQPLDGPVAAPLLPRVAAFLSQFVDQLSYGFFPGGDPRLFSPDPECSTEAEREAHRLACEAWERGERPDLTVGCGGTLHLHGEHEDLVAALPPAPPGPQRPHRFPVATRIEGSETVFECLTWPRLTARGATYFEALRAMRVALRERIDAASESEWAETIDATMVTAEPPLVVEEPPPHGFGLGSYTHGDEEAEKLLASVRAALGGETAPSSALADVAAERAHQDDKWGGAEHDDAHDGLDWLSYLLEHAAKALSGSVGAERGKEPSVNLFHDRRWTFTVTIPPGEARNPRAFRSQLVRVAALAVAAIESHDRRAAKGGAAPPAPSTEPAPEED